MVKIRKKILAVLLTAAMLVSMSSVVAWSDEQPATDEGTSQTEQTAADDNSSEDKEDKSDKKNDKDDKKKPRTDAEGLAEMKVIAENDSYKLSFFNSRIVIEESELAGDRIYSYQPVMIRFEDIDLKVIDCGGLYVLIFKKDYIYTVPKSAMNEQMNEVFRRHLSNILGDDYREYTIKQDKQDKQSKFEKLKKHTKKASESGADADETERE